MPGSEDSSPTQTLEELLQSEKVHGTPAFAPARPKYHDIPVYHLTLQELLPSKPSKFNLDIPSLLRTESQKVERSHVAGETDETIRILSETYSHVYPDLLRRFREWKPAREELVRVLTRSSEQVAPYSYLASAFRIGTSVADMLGTIWSIGRRFDSQIVQISVEYFSILGILTLFAEALLFHNMYTDIEMAIREDQMRLSEIRKWFQQTEELNAAVPDIFPFGIDAEIMRKINTYADSLPECDMKFMSRVASELRKKGTLYKNKGLKMEAKSDAEFDMKNQWLRRIIRRNGLYFKHCLDSSLAEEMLYIPQILLAKEELYIESTRYLTRKPGLKISLNILSIVSAVCNIMYGDKKLESAKFKNLAIIANKELIKFEKAIYDLRPHDSDRDLRLSDYERACWSESAPLPENQSSSRHRKPIIMCT